MVIRNSVGKIFFAFLLIISTAVPALSAPSLDARRVLVIHSYHSGLPWTDDVMSGIRDSLTRRAPDIQISAEYLDARRYPRSDISRSVREMVISKIKHEVPDLVIVSDNQALELVMEIRNILFPDAPVVFCGINDYNPFMIAGHRGITGVAEELSIVGSVALALSLHPDTKEIVVIGRTSVAADKVNRDSFLAALPRLPSQLKITFWDDLPTTELKKRLEELRDGAVIFINGLIMDESGRQLMYAETTKWISRHSKVPTYSFWDVYLGHGIVGGLLVSGYQQGKMAGEIALRVLDGESADQIPVVTGIEANRYMFDYRQLERFKIPITELPPDSIIINRPDSFYEKHKFLIWATIVVFLVLTSLVALLGIAVIRRRRAERALKLSEDRTRLFFERQIVGMAVVSPDNRWLQVNDRLCRMLGYSREELTRMTWIQITHPDDLAEDMEWVKRLISGDIDEFTREKRYIRKDGTIIAVNLSVVCVRKDDGSVDYALALVEDLTEAKHAAEEHEKLREQLAQAQKLESLGQLAGGVAHDFNNFLTAILGHAQLGMTLCEPSAPIYNSFKAIEESALRSADLVRQLLAFARRQTITPKVLDINEVTSNMLKILQRLMGENIDLVWKPKTGLWPVKIDPSQIDQILANLCVNARDAITGVGEVIIETENAALDEAYCAVHPEAVPGEYVMISVSDNGVGIDKDTLGHIFEPFFTTKKSGRGTGLGLSTVYGIVKQNNGFINVYSELGKGSSFKIYLPRCEGEIETDASRDNAQILMGHGETILLVEDDAMLLDVSRSMLESLGYNVLVAETPGSAIKIATTYAGAIHLVMTDVIMPEMNGRELARSLALVRPELKFLFASGYTADIIANHGALEEGIKFIQKPFSLRDLASKAREAIEG